MVFPLTVVLAVVSAAVLADVLAEVSAAVLAEVSAAAAAAWVLSAETLFRNCVFFGGIVLKFHSVEVPGSISF